MLFRRFRVASTSLVFVALLLLAAPALAQSNARTPLMTIVLTWMPFLVIIALWWLFMRRINPQKGGYAAAMQRSQEISATMASHLERIAASLERIASALESSDAAIERARPRHGG